MKLILSTALILLSSTLFSQDVIGKIVTLNGFEIPLYDGDSRRWKLSNLRNECDCQYTRTNKILFINKWGKLAIFKLKEMEKLVLNKGVVYCRESPRTSRWFEQTPVSKVELKQNETLLSLPFSKNGKKAFQTVLIQNDRYILSLHQKTNTKRTINISSKLDGEFVDGDYDFLENGFNKDGENMLASIRNYFNSCDQVLAIIDENLKHNEKETSTKKFPLLNKVFGISCQ